MSEIEQYPVAWLIEYTHNGILWRKVYLHNCVGDYRDLDPAAKSTPLYKLKDAAS